MKKIGQNDSMPGTNRWREMWSRVAAKVVCLFVAVLFLVPAAFGQNDGPEIKISTELAPFEVSVSDRSGNPVRGLSASEFRVFEDGTERPIDFFQAIKKKDSERPLTIVFALDVSGSMTDAELERLKAAMQKFVKRLADYESLFAVMSFAMEVKTAQGFTNRPDRLEQAFEKLRKDQDGLSTHAYDAVDQAIRLIQKKSPKTLKDRFPRRAVILITDGFPVGDVVSPQTVAERANANETSVFSVLLPSYSRLQRDNKRVLTPLEASGLSERTGGLNIAANESNFDRIFDALAEELTSSYVIAFYPRDEDKNGSREIKVRIESKSGFLVRQNRDRYKPGS